MALIIDSQRAVFDLTQIKRGDLAFCKHRSWDEGKGGIVARASEDELIIQFHPGIGNVVNHFSVPSSEAAEGQWEIRWSEDLTEIHEGVGI